MRIGVLEPLHIDASVLDELARPLRELGHTVIAYDTRADNDDVLLERSRECDIVIIANRPYPARVIEQLSTTKLIDVAFAGVDHVDLDACAKQGIAVANASGYASQAVAEHTLAMTLAIYRKIVQTDHQIRTQFDTLIAPIGQEICGKTVGIVGTGSTGSATARLFHALGAQLLGYNRCENADMRELGLSYCSLETLLEQSDIVTLHVPGNQSTYHMINAQMIHRMQRHAILVNVARGMVVDNQALAQALCEASIAGAAIDVFDTEPPIADTNPLLHAPNCLLTPHVAYYTTEAMLKRARIVFANALAFVNNAPTNLVLMQGGDCA